MIILYCLILRKYQLYVNKVPAGTIAYMSAGILYTLIYLLDLQGGQVVMQPTLLI